MLSFGGVGVLTRRVLFLLEPTNLFIGVQVVIREVSKVPGIIIVIIIIVLMMVVVLPHASVYIAGHVRVCHARLNRPVKASVAALFTRPNTLNPPCQPTHGIERFDGFYD